MTGTCTMHDTCKHRQCAECEDALPPVKTVTQEQKWREEFDKWRYSLDWEPMAPEKAFLTARAIDAQRIAELEAIAERYNFMRRITNEPHILELLNATDADPESPDAFDAAIDAAIAAAKRKGE